MRLIAKFCYNNLFHFKTLQFLLTKFLTISSMSFLEIIQDTLLSLQSVSYHHPIYQIHYCLLAHRSSYPQQMKVFEIQKRNLNSFEKVHVEQLI